MWTKTPIDNDGEIITVILTQYEVAQFKEMHNIEYVEDLSKVVNKLVKQQFNT